MELRGWILLALPSIPSHRGPEGGETQFLRPRREVMMGRRAGDRSQGTGLIRAQLGYRAPREGPCNTQHFAGSDLRCPRLWLPPAAQLSGEEPDRGRDPLGIPAPSPPPSVKPLPKGHRLLLSHRLPLRGPGIFIARMIR